MSNYIILAVGCLLVCMSQYPLISIPYGLTNVLLVVGIISMIHGVTWDFKQ